MRPSIVLGFALAACVALGAEINKASLVMLREAAFAAISAGR